MCWPECELLCTNLGEEGIELAGKESPDIVILDLSLPDISGYGVLKKVRSSSSVPIIMVSSNEDEVNVVKSLEWGADEYLTKPVQQLELLARAKALLRRSGSLPESVI